MEAPESILNGISDSLKPKAHTKPEVKTQKPTVAADLTSALLKLPEIAQSLSELETERRREVDLLGAFERIDLDVKATLGKVDSSLKQINSVVSLVQSSQTRLNLMEAKQARMIERVDGVLSELERFLKQL
jgi:hypothetical protein